MAPIALPRRGLREFLATKVIQVYHQDSPGERVYVRRGWLKRLLYSRRFSMIGEHHLSEQELVPTRRQATALALRFRMLYQKSNTSLTDGLRLDPLESVRLISVCMNLITGGYELESSEEEWEYTRRLLTSC